MNNLRQDIRQFKRLILKLNQEYPSLSSPKSKQVNNPP